MVKTRRKKGGRRSKKQRIYNMKGCSAKRHQNGGVGCGSNGCPIAPLSTKQMNNMTGGSCNNCGSCGNILGIAQTGGQCTNCSCSMNGGSFYKTNLAPVPAPLVGKPWGPEVSQWPGVDGISSGRNYFTNNLYKVDPQTMMHLGGSRSKSRSKSRRRQQKKRCKGVCGPICSCKGSCGGKCNCSPKCSCGCQKNKVIKGGAFLPDITGLGRDLMYNFQSTYNSLNGFPAPTNPKPYIQPALLESNPK